MLNGLRRFNVFTVRIYLKYWFLCQLAPKAPANDLKLLQELESFKAIDKDTANAAQNKLRGHLWYLSEANIALAFFDDEVDFETKKKMLLNLNKEGHPDNPKRISLLAS